MAARGVERLLNVIMTIGSRRRIDRAKLFAVIPEYADAPSETAAERMFERDKAQILELGLPLRTEADLFDENTVYYRIEAAEADAVLDLSTEEYTVLLAASRAWDDAAAGGAARRVRAKLLSLGHDADPDLLRRTPRGAVESLPVLSPLLEAVTAGTAVGFAYRSARGQLQDRRVEPWVVGVHDGHWYLLGWDLDREASRLFRASRIESFPERGGTATRPRPADLDIASALGAQDPSEETASAELRVEPFKALALRERAGAALDAPTVTLPPQPRAAARRQILGDARWIELLAPAAWREELACVLTTVAERHAGPADTAPLESASPRVPRRIRTTTTGTDRLSRLISEASYVMQRGEVELAELAAAVGISEKQLVADLEILFLCGDLGTGWEDLIEAEWEHGVVRVRNAEPLRRGLRLSAAEVTALLAGIAALEPSAGETAAVLASARAKLLASIDPESDSEIDPEGRAASPVAGGEASARGGSDPAPTAEPAGDRAERVLAAVQAALPTAEGEAGPGLTIRYSAPDRPGTSVRRIHPLRLETSGPRSYLLADCELAGGRRSFRLDRVVEVLGPDAVQHRDEPAPAVDLSGIVEDGVWLRLEPPARWVAEAFEAAELRDAPVAGEQAPVVYARLEAPVRAALVDAVLEAAGAAEVLSPPALRDTIVMVTRETASRHGAPDAIP